MLFVASLSREHIIVDDNRAVEVLRKFLGTSVMLVVLEKLIIE
jgi:hypothetical protein